jgi:hypothetical protein
MMPIALNGQRVSNGKPFQRSAELASWILVQIIVLIRPQSPDIFRVSGERSSATACQNCPAKNFNRPQAKQNHRRQEEKS